MSIFDHLLQWPRSFCMKPFPGLDHSELKQELENFKEIFHHIVPLPGEIPAVKGIDVYGDTIPLNGVVGGDHIIFVDFKKRYDLNARIEQAKAAARMDIVTKLQECKSKAGVAVLDVSGHLATDAMLAAMLHQALLLGALYELDMFGNITRRLFENLNSRFYQSSSRYKFMTMIYGEISEDATFRFLSAAHPPPVVFSNYHERFMEVSEDLCTSFPPIGTLPSKDVIDWNTTTSSLGFKERYHLNQWKLMGAGDILLLYTDGLLEHTRGEEPYFPEHLENTIRAVKHESAKKIFQTIKRSALDFAKVSDDISVVVIKRT
jgi:serine phosphatase RsbU (regulator of sigma subunit)